jgi:hypothetical protein
MNIEKLSNSFKSWSELTEDEKDFFCGDEYLPFHKNHEERVSVLSGSDAREMIKQALFQIPEYKAGVISGKRDEDYILLGDVWGSEERVQDVRQWLYDKGIPFSTIVYLFYDNQVVKVDWKFLVTYWDALAWNVGMAMVITDLTGKWACEFHHEDVITFYEYTAST